MNARLSVGGDELKSLESFVMFFYCIRTIKDVD